MAITQNGNLILSGCLVINNNHEILLLYKTKHKHYETPGGKVELEECSNPKNPTIEDLTKAAERELFEELGKDIQVSPLKYFCKVEFIIPDGRKAIAYKFITKILYGTPIITEPETFSKLDYLPLSDLENYSISPDLKLLVNKLKKL